jgi:hypothetical protein
MAQGWHEDFGDCPSIEERIPEGWDFVDTSVEDDEPNDEPNEDMDGDFDSGMASAGFGTDEDYNHYDYGDHGGEG